MSNSIQYLYHLNLNWFHQDPCIFEFILGYQYYIQAIFKLLHWNQLAIIYTDINNWMIFITEAKPW